MTRSMHYRTRQALACVTRNVLPLDDRDIIVRLTLLVFVDDPDDPFGEIEDNLTRLQRATAIPIEVDRYPFYARFRQ